jgi:hypothetical protein
MKKKNKTVELITKLLQLTSESKIRWKSSAIPLCITNGTDDIVSSYFQTQYNGKVFSLYIRRYQQYSGEFDMLYWSEEIKLAIIDGDRIIWSNTNYPSALKDLYEYVQEQAAGLDDILEGLLDD